MAYSLIIPYYRNPQMLITQLTKINHYPADIEVIIVDDGSPEPALPIIREYALRPVSLYRIGVDIPWNRGGARNLGATQAMHDWIVHIDIDHVLMPEHAEKLLAFVPDKKHWYRFPRWRFGQADETRMKDNVPRDSAFVKIHPHVDSYLCQKSDFWKAGGYNEDFSGCLGGGSPFLKELEKIKGAPVMLPDSIFLRVYTRSSCPDASDNTLSRDKTAFTLRKMKLKGNFKGHRPLRFPWNKQL